MLKLRSYEPELLDADVIPAADLYRNLQELDTINTLLGGHAVTLRALKTFALNQNTTYSILEIGSGGGDNLRAMARWAAKGGINLKLLGVDIKSDCVAYANLQCKNYPAISFRCCDYRELLTEDNTYDIIFTSLFCHHFSEPALTDLFRFKHRKSKLGFFMNDLHRHPAAYYAIALLTKTFSKSYLVKNDAKLSVARGFKRVELEALMQAVPVAGCKLQWAWAFRWLLTYRHKKTGNNL